MFEKWFFPFLSIVSPFQHCLFFLLFFQERGFCNYALSVFILLISFHPKTHILESESNNGPSKKALTSSAWSLEKSDTVRLQRELGENPNQSEKFYSLWWKGRYVASDMRSWKTFSASVFGVFGSPFPGGIQLSWKGTTLRPPFWEEAQAVTSFPITSSVLTTPRYIHFPPLVL